MGDDLEVEVLRGVGRSDPSEPQGEMIPSARAALKEGASESASRGTRTGYEAVPSRASGQMTVKLSRPRLRRCKSGGCAEKVIVLTWGDLASRLKGWFGGVPSGSEKSAEAVVPRVQDRTQGKP